SLGNIVRRYFYLNKNNQFYGKNSSYVHGGLDSNGKPADAVYGQKEIHRKVMSQNFTNCHTKIRHVDAHATLNDGVVVQVMGLLSNNNQALRRFMQTFVLAPEVHLALFLAQPLFLNHLFLQGGLVLFSYTYERVTSLY
uniref:NTF2 domain-containing protein n=1 Tax=Colobus angolensis palliatus TaxID=336983 RepID=A0A2K5KCS8_COLAP